jgi:3-isopropylmalate dehydrogenase
MRQRDWSAARHGPGLSIGRGDIAMAQATHGSADIAGQGKANPYAMIESTRMMLEWLGGRRGIAEATGASDIMRAASTRRWRIRLRVRRHSRQGRLRDMVDGILKAWPASGAHSPR